MAAVSSEKQINGDISILRSHDYCQHQTILCENRKLKEALENARGEIRKHEDQLKTAQELIDTQRKYVQEAETNLQNLRQVEKENKKLKVELEEERELRTNADDLAINLQKLLLKFEDVPKKSSKVNALKVLGLEAKLAARSTENDAIFDTNIKVIYNQMHNFLDLVKTSLTLIKNHQKERRDEIENIVRKLVSCCLYNSAGEDMVEEDSAIINIDEEDDMDTSGEVNNGKDTPNDLMDNIDTIDTTATSSEDNNNNDNLGEAGNDCGVSCFDPIELNGESEANLTPRKSIRQRRRSVSLRDYAVSREALEIHEDQKDLQLEEKDECSTKTVNGKCKSKKKFAAAKQALNQNLIRNFPCKVCKKRFKNAGKLKRHIKSHNISRISEDSHSKRKICYRCGKFFSTKELLDFHHKENHAEDMSKERQLE